MNEENNDYPAQAPSAPSAPYNMPAPEQYPQPVPEQYPQPVPVQYYPQQAPVQYYPQQPPIIIESPAPTPAPAPAPAPAAQYVPVGLKSNRMTCPSCAAGVMSKVTRRPTSRAHKWALFLCCIGCHPFCLVPYCMDSCRSAEHSCPNCSAYLGTYAG